MEHALSCPRCGATVVSYRNPAPTVDVIIHDSRRGVVLITRKNPPHGHALPGGFIDEGECAEAAAVREMREETHLEVELIGLLGVYSDPARDPRRHTMSTVFVGRARDCAALAAGDDAGTVAFYPLDALPAPLCFDHGRILADFAAVLRGERALAPVQPMPAVQADAGGEAG